MLLAFFIEHITIGKIDSVVFKLTSKGFHAYSVRLIFSVQLLSLFLNTIFISRKQKCLVHLFLRTLMCFFFISNYCGVRRLFKLKLRSLIPNPYILGRRTFWQCSSWSKSKNKRNLLEIYSIYFLKKTHINDMKMYFRYGGSFRDSCSVVKCKIIKQNEKTEQETQNFYALAITKQKSRRILWAL